MTVYIPTCKISSDDYKFGSTSKGNPAIIWNGYQYGQTKCRSKNGSFYKSYWACLKFRSSLRCKARAVLESNLNVVLRYNHNHPP